MLTKAQITDGFEKMINCSMQVVREKAEELGLDKELGMRIAAPFGGGMLRGDTCGAVTGALILIGMKYGHSNENDAENYRTVCEKATQFLEQFQARNKTLICRELIGYDFSQGESEKAAESGIMIKKCPKLIQDALEILDDIL